MANQTISNTTGLGLTRERSFVRTQQANKRRSLANEIVDTIQNQQLRTKPAIEIYRPPSINAKINETLYYDEFYLNLNSYRSIDIRSDGKLNVNAPEFKLQCGQPFNFPQFIQHSKSSGNIQQQIQLAVAARRHVIQMANSSSNQIFSNPYEVPNPEVPTLSCNINVRIESSIINMRVVIKTITNQIFAKDCVSKCIGVVNEN